MNPQATATAAASRVLVCFALLCLLACKLQEFFVFGARACSTNSSPFCFLAIYI
jgi:hypothetical protein